MPLTTFLKKLSPGRIIALGFLFCILLGSLLLILPCSLQPGIALPYLDALYTATSAVCVTGLNVIDPGSTFSAFGQFVLGLPDPDRRTGCRFHRCRDHARNGQKGQSERTPCYP